MGHDAGMRDGDIGPGGHRGELYAAVAAMAFGSAYVATSFALRGFDPLPAAAWRSFLAVLLLGGVLVAGDRSTRARQVVGPARRSSTLPARALRLAVIAILSGPVFIVSMNLAVAHVGATITAFVAGLYAVLSAVIAPAFLPERLAPRVLVGFLLALAGTVLLAELNPGAEDVAGIAWGLAAAIAFALFLVLSRRWSMRYGLDGAVISMASMAATALTVGGVVLLSDPASLTPVSPPLESLIAIGWLACAAVSGQLLTVASVRRIPAARSAAFLLLNPITATILAALLLGERLTILQLAGGLLVLFGLAVATVPSGRMRRITPRRG
jgi:drug/metabolite transporter, DME family